MNKKDLMLLDVDKYQLYLLALYLKKNKPNKSRK